MEKGIHLNLPCKCLQISLPHTTYPQFLIGSCQHLVSIALICVSFPFDVWLFDMPQLTYCMTEVSVAFLLPLTFFIWSQHHLSKTEHFHLPVDACRVTR